MIVSLAALLLGSMTTLPDADLQPEQLPEIFEAACLNGEARLSPADAQSVGFDALPVELRQGLGSPSSAQVWRLNGPGHAFLYVLQYQAGRASSPRICGLASDEMDYNAAADTVEMRVTGAVHPRTTETTEWLNPKGGYDALATTAGDFKVLQVNWLSNSARRALIRIQPAIP